MKKCYPIKLLLLILLLNSYVTLNASPVNFIGTVSRIAGDLVYVEGLNDQVQLGSYLETIRSDSISTTGLRVIKILDQMLVTIKIQNSSPPVKINDQVRVISDKPIVLTDRIVTAVRIADGPRLDGRLDDAAWESAIPIEGFVQRDPEYWMPATENTVARIVYDEAKIYFGFECFDSQPQLGVANNMRRDSEIFGDDNIQILLDTFNDRQTGVIFFTNPLGAKRDVLLSNEGRTFNEDWDCIWEVKCLRHEKGWNAEIAISFSQLRFKEAEEMIWGINLGRFVARKNEDAALMVGRYYSSPRVKYWTSYLGLLKGLKSIKPKRLFQMKPYVLPGTSKDFIAPNSVEDQSFETGLDMRYGITSNLTLDVSFNTDFAQVEGDQEQVNLTQFSLFFPEKREFFLESASLFDFGEAAERRGGDDKPPTLLFYSRRIGLEEGQPIPIIFGGKLSGKTGRTSIGALNVLTDSENSGDDIQITRNNFSVVRIKQDVLERSNIGIIAVNKQKNQNSQNWDHYNRAGGFDFSLSPSRELNIQGFYARTWDSKIDASDDARFAQIDYSGSRYAGRFTYLDIEDQFIPEVGFVNRRRGLQGFKRYEGQAYIRPSPSFWDIRSIRIGPEVQIIADQQNDLQFWSAAFDISTQFNSSDRFGLTLEQTFDKVTEAFQPSRRSNIEIPIGDYHSTTFSLSPRTSRARKLQIEAKVEAGTYFTGNRYSFEFESAFRPSGRLSMETIYNFNWIRLPEGNLNVQTLSNRLLYSFTTEFFIKLFTQWNNDKELVSANFLLNYRFRPGSDLFFVYDHGFNTENGLYQTNRAILIKLSYLIGM
jgi:hypothetical protein